MKIFLLTLHDIDFIISKARYDILTHNRKEIAMKRAFAAALIVVLFAVLAGCGSHEENSYIGFTAEDFTGKTIYMMDAENPGKSQILTFSDKTVRVSSFPADFGLGSLKWDVVNGRLVTTEMLVYQPLEWQYTLFNDDASERCFTAARKRPESDSYKIVTLYYDQNTGSAQAAEWMSSF